MQSARLTFPEGRSDQLYQHHGLHRIGDRLPDGVLGNPFASAGLQSLNDETRSVFG